MRASDIRDLLKKSPFEPFMMGLSDGRAVFIRHPDQAVVTDRHVFVRLARLTRSKPLSTPASGDTIAKEWIFVNLLHIATIEPDEKNGTNGRRKAKRRRKS